MPVIVAPVRCVCNRTCGRKQGVDGKQCPYQLSVTSVALRHWTVTVVGRGVRRWADPPKVSTAATVRPGVPPKRHNGPLR
ncbi:hypothetical protein GCM10009745_06510 [Kribbella yunnanensis]|uniref:Uncharacterized protein n=1 Tax=Kribbella yunnanensis TaxID=190194 RepID=A0ABP4S6M5_9ACTN